ncbi:MAG: N-acetylgalactosamine 6-sulfate sulfatase, partial [Verrucomicrobiae bacterium]|nr:N-acetylgalactosamine 6-sulfate sulfatase [Verrucomicrobiae bacterium]NNJ85671.1 N-acetylgalactosamine 6-sulfate sulfatase [Akkermansiaceae bacterium]
KGAAGDPDRTMVWVRREGGARYQGRAYYAIRKGPWKLLQNHPFEPMQLVNLADDPYEQNPLPAEGKSAKQLTDALMKHIQAAGSVPWQAPMAKQP